MTLDEIHKAIETKLGIPLTVESIENRWHATLVATSPTGVRLFEIHVSKAHLSDNWNFGGCGSLLTGSWKDLCEISGTFYADLPQTGARMGA